MTRTFLKKKFTLKSISGQKQRCIQTLEASKETHPATLNIPLKGKTQGIHDCVQKTRVYTRISQSKPCVHVTVRQKLTYVSGYISQSRVYTRL